MPRDYTGGQGGGRPHAPESDPGFAGIPGPEPENICPDCGCRPRHWKTECAHCGCADGITRKRQRDAEQVIGHTPGADRPVTGFA